ncbi:hypothetical protein B808_26 [Fructilactobacillus florum 8D]|uniref:Uncharacterized protein n=1 Tax=Fructilactobacillus florum 8D TaxID=1221538 RepID=W9EIE0_9LACO|nr:hypothetical protein B808_26 [Fructilactobacillus florum 8D]
MSQLTKAHSLALRQLTLWLVSQLNGSSTNYSYYLRPLFDLLKA